MNKKTNNDIQIFLKDIKAYLFNEVSLEDNKNNTYFLNFLRNKLKYLINNNSEFNKLINNREEYND